MNVFTPGNQVIDLDNFPSIPPPRKWAMIPQKSFSKAPISLQVWWALGIEYVFEVRELTRRRKGI